jgi:hypothetical protein
VTVDPEDLGQRDQLRPRADLGENDLVGVRRRTVADARDPDGGGTHRQRSDQAEVLRVGRHDLVALSEPEPVQHDVAALRGRRRERDALDGHADELGEPRAHAGSVLEVLVEGGPVEASLHESALLLGGDRVGDRCRHRPERPGVQVGVASEHGKLRAGFLERHRASSSTGA